MDESPTLLCDAFVVALCLFEFNLGACAVIRYFLTFDNLGDNSYLIGYSCFDDSVCSAK